MRVIVTGATGFLGGRVCRMLRDGGHDVLAIGRDRDRGRLLREEGIAFLPADLTSTPDAAILRELGAADGFVHAAALSSAWGPRAAFLKANVIGTRNALTMARSAGVGRFVFISSPSVGFRFVDQIDVREDAPLPAPVNPYAESKQIAEETVILAQDLSPVVLRPRALYGAGDSALLPRLMRAAARGPLPLMRGGRARTNLTHVDDAAAATLAALLAPAAAGGRVFNIAGEVLPVRTIAERVAARVGVSIRWRAVPWLLALAAARTGETLARLTPGQPEPPITAFGLGLLAFSQTLDVSAAERVLGFRPAVSFEEGLARTFARAVDR